MMGHTTDFAIEGSILISRALTEVKKKENPEFTILGKRVKLYQSLFEYTKSDALKK